MSTKRDPANWWRFTGDGGEFAATGAARIGRLYFPIANESGMRSWVSPQLQGGPASSHNEYLGVPLTAEDLPHVLAHRGFWITEKDRNPFSLSALSPDGLRAHLDGGASRIDAGPGWFTLSRADRQRRFAVRATLWCPADLDEKVELMLVEVTNTSRRKISFSPYAAVPLFARSADDVRDHRHVTALLHRIRLSRHGVTVRPTMSFDERGHKVNRVEYTVLAFGAAGAAPAAVWPTQEGFLGEAGNFATPAAVWRRERGPANRVCTMQGKEAIGGFRFADTTLAPGKTARFVLLSGISDDPRRVQKWAAWAKQPGRALRSLELTKKHWQGQLSRIQFGTPDRDLNNWLTWVTFQPMLRRIYGNSYLPQFDYGRGGKGWRDLWQDCLALLLSDPDSVRPMLLHNFGGVRIDGSNATIIGRGGAFIADRNNIPRTWMDHGVWPTYTTLLYIDQTGDLGFLLREREYFRDPQVRRCRTRDPRWTDAYGHQLRARNGKVYRGTVLEHLLVQNLAAFFNVGEHKLCRLEGADWNDGLDMAPERGESVAFSAFYAWNLERLADYLAALQRRGHRKVLLAKELLMLLGSAPGRSSRLEAYLDVVADDVSGQRKTVRADELARDLRAKSRDLANRIRRQEWLTVGRGLSFFNGYYDNVGRRVEGRRGGRIRMTLTGQVFPLMTGIATDEQTDAVVESVHRLLKDPRSGGVRLNTDFGGIQPELGRAFSFAYGEKENGAVFSHMAIMYAFALYHRRRARAGRDVWATLYRMAMDPRTARIFPCVPEYFGAEGRGMYCYLTGSASWLIYLLLTQVFGIRGALGDLVIDPQLDAKDFDARGECSVRTFFAGKPLRITYQNPDRLPAGRYVVGVVSAGTRALVFDPLPEGGARLKRSAFRAFPSDRDTRLVVRLVKAS